MVVGFTAVNAPDLAAAVAYRPGFGAAQCLQNCTDQVSWPRFKARRQVRDKLPPPRHLKFITKEGIPC